MPPAVKLYPTIRYYGFDDAIKIFSEMDGSEAGWFQRDVKTWVRLGIETRYRWHKTSLAKCTLNEYQIDYLKLYKSDIKKLLQYISKEQFYELKPLIDALDLDIEEPKE